MKKSLLILILIVLTVNLKSQIKVVSGGNVGVGNLNPTDKLHVTGTTRLNGTTVFDNWTDVMVQWTGGYCCGIPTIIPENDWYLQIGTPSKYAGLSYISHMFTKQSVSFISDKNFKTNINYQLSSSYTKLLTLKPASFNFLPALFPGVPSSVVNDFCSRKQYGFMAQDMITVFPELVEKDSSGILYIDYLELVPIIVEGAIVQNTKLNKLQSQLDSLKNVVSQCCAGNSQNRLLNPGGNSGANDGNNGVGIKNQSSSYIKQNIPNPFNRETNIEYFIAERNANASMLIFDMSGKLLKTLKLNNSGTGTITINGNDLQPGMYYYSLIVNGIEVDTKKMILTEQ